MPKQRQTCTRCSQRRQKCDRRTPCTRCVQNAEGHLCTTKWLDGYNPSVHRRYPRKTSPMTSWRSTASSETSSSGRQAVDQQALSAGPEPIDVVRTPSANPPAEASRWSTSLPDVTINSLLTSKDQPQVNPLLEYTFTYVKTKGGLKDLAGVSSTAACSYSPTARVAEIQHLHSLLPPKERVLAITDYYEQYMLYWVGALYHAPTFRKTLLEAYGTSQELSLTTLDWRFSALFFSILAAAMSGSPESSSMAWGFTIDDKVRLARAWGNACVSCLNLGNYTSRYHIWSVQAIYIMHAYEHLIGSTNQWLALRAVAVVIAKGLGLHKIATHPDDDRVHELNGVQMQAFKDREMGRRVWRTVALQEWLSASAQSSTAVSIQKNHFITTIPHDLHEDTMKPLTDENVPPLTIVGTFFYDFAELMLDFHNVMAKAEDEDDYVRYIRVLKFDGELRSLCTEKIPTCLSPRTPHDPNWPRWVGWARRLYQTNVNHKLIMIHQAYLSKSFKDLRYTYSRWACSTCSKNIINLYNTREPDEPQWWVEHGYIVTAAICLILDLFQRTTADPEVLEHQACVRRSISYLQHFPTSSVAIHGVRLLVSLLQEYAKIQEGSKTAVTPGSIWNYVPSSCTNAGDIPLPGQARVPQPMQPEWELPILQEDAGTFNFDSIDALGFDDLTEYMPTDGISNAVFFDNIYSANGQFNW